MRGEPIDGDNTITPPASATHKSDQSTKKKRPTSNYQAKEFLVQARLNFVAACHLHLAFKHLLGLRIWNRALAIQSAFCIII